MKLGTQIYSKPSKNQKCIQIRYNPDERYETALNFTGYAYVDCKYKLVKNMLEDIAPEILVTDQDLIARDDYIEALGNKTVVVLVFNKGDKTSIGFSNNAFNGCGASKKRLQAAKKKLRSRGIKVRLFASEQTCLNYLNKVKVGAS